MDSALALGLVLVAAAYLLRRSVQTFHAPAKSACGSSEACGSDCAPEPDAPLVQLDLPAQSSPGKRNP